MSEPVFTLTYFETEFLSTIAESMQAVAEASGKYGQLLHCAQAIRQTVVAYGYDDPCTACAVLEAWPMRCLGQHGHRGDHIGKIGGASYRWSD
jgi:hypothetical protein